MPFAGLALALVAGSAAAGDSAITLRATTDRQPNDFALPKDASYEFAAEHAFDSGWIVGGSVTYTDPAFTGTATANLEGTVSYRARFSDVFSIVATAGGGEHFQSPEAGIDFPYYMLRIVADLKLSERVTWSAVSFRYRNAFDPSNDYDTPQLATELFYQLDKHNKVSAKLAGNWSNGDYSSTGLSVAYTFGF
jgi:hypothetical protein